MSLKTLKIIIARRRNVIVLFVSTEIDRNGPIAEMKCPFTARRRILFCRNKSQRDDATEITFNRENLPCTNQRNTSMETAANGICERTNQTYDLSLFSENRLFFSEENRLLRCFDKSLLNFSCAHYAVYIYTATDVYDLKSNFRNK